MELNLPIVAKKVWGMVRVIFYMLRKGISKRKLLLDLNLMLKRGNKIATKALNSLISFHLHHHHHHNNHHQYSFTAPPCEYEFSCSNTPSYSLPSFHLGKRRTNIFACAFHAPPTHDDDVATMNAVKLALEMLNTNNNNGNSVSELNAMVEASPMLPGFGPSPMVRKLRITDSPFPLRDVDDDNGIVDKKAEEFIQKFYKELRKQK